MAAGTNPNSAVYGTNGNRALLRICAGDSVVVAANRRTRRCP